MPFVSLDDILSDLMDLRIRVPQLEEKVARLEQFELERIKAAEAAKKSEPSPIPRRIRGN